MAYDTYYATLSPLIEASLSPVFLLSAIGITLSILDARQARIVDRVRVIETQISGRPLEADSFRREIAFYLSRARRIAGAASLCILSALCVASVVVTLLLDAQTAVRLALIVEVTFTGAVLLYGLALVLFLRDILQVNTGLEYVHQRALRHLGGTDRPSD